MAAVASPSKKRRTTKIDSAGGAGKAKVETSKPKGAPVSAFDGASDWLVKAEPAEYSISDFEKDTITEWDGVRNHQAKNNLRKMRKGQRVLYYESNPARGTRPGVVGRCTVEREDYPDPTQFDSKHAYYDSKSTEEKPRWACVDLRFGARLARRVTIDELREQMPECGLFRFPRLSVVPLREGEFEQVLGLSEQEAPPAPAKGKGKGKGKGKAKSSKDASTGASAGASKKEGASRSKAKSRTAASSSGSSGGGAGTGAGHSTIGGKRKRGGGST